MAQDSQREPEPTSLLSGWKDIAGYVRRGTRTVQRWERYYGFPVRRTHVGPKSTVLGIPAEIDAWVRARDFRVLKQGSFKSEQMLLLQSLRELRAENQELRRQLEAERAKGK